MKKNLLIFGFVFLAVVALGFAGSVYAQTPIPSNPEETTPNYGQGRGQMRGQGWMAGGMYSADGENGPMHEVIIASMAEALGIDAQTPEERLENGETMNTIAADLGFSPEDFQARMLEARQQALEQAVAAGLITAEQAEWMQSRMQGSGAGGFGPASGNCDGTGESVGDGLGSRHGRGGGMRGGR